MKIGTKIAAGYTLTTTLLLIVALYQFYTIHQLLRADRRLATIDFQIGLKALHIYQEFETLQEFTEKYLAIGEPAYGRHIRSMRQRLDRLLAELSQYPHRGAGEAEIQRTLSLWDGLAVRVLEIERAYEDEASDSELQGFLPTVEEMDPFLPQIERVIDEIQLSVSDEYAHSRQLVKRLEWVSWGVLATGLGLSVLVCFLVVRSISKPLKQLAIGTRKVSEGDFSFHADDTGEDEVAELAGHFNAMMQRLGALDQLKKDFVSHVSHELKAPVASMQETTRLLLEEIPGRLNEQQKKLLQLNEKSGDRLSSMISNLLDLSTIEAGAMRYTFATIDFASLVRRVQEEFHGLYLDKNLRIEALLPSKPVTVRADEHRCIQVVGNLIANAVKFSPEGSLIRLELKILDALPDNWAKDTKKEVSKSAHGHCRLSVFDEGPGVPDREKSKIFEKFYAARSGKKLSGQGTGLGLTISRRIAEAHGGILWVEDRPGGGSIFHFVLALSGRDESD